MIHHLCNTNIPIVNNNNNNPEKQLDLAVLEVDNPNNLINTNRNSTTSDFFRRDSRINNSLQRKAGLPSHKVNFNRFNKSTRPAKYFTVMKLRIIVNNNYNNNNNNNYYYYYYFRLFFNSLFRSHFRSGHDSKRLPQKNLWAVMWSETIGLRTRPI